MLIDVGNGYSAIIDDECFALINFYSWGHVVGSTGIVYAVRKSADKSHMHNVIMKPRYGLVVDHINGNGLDNRLSNLRICTYRQNMWNRRKTARPTSSIYKGVSWIKSHERWRASIRHYGKSIYLGEFIDEVEAAKAYDAAAEHYFGEYAALNFPRDLVVNFN